MENKITNAALITAGKTLRAYIGNNTIPYVKNGMDLNGMDCQGMVEYLLIQAGVPKSECGLAGSNAHWRNAVWRGSIAECIKTFGCIPGGACIGIHDDEGGEPASYQGDGLGNCSHMGLQWTESGKYVSIAASAGQKQVIQSNFNGKAINGGWNVVFLLPWVDYGLGEAQLIAAGFTGADGTVTTSDTVASAASTNPVVNLDSSTFYPVKRGCKGGAVERLQTWLNDLGYPLNVDHDFGPATDAAVRQFQQAQGLEVDGYVGKQTWAALATAVQNK